MQKQAFFSLALGALGVVYGDIGTSPLYAIRESLDGLPINLIDVLGVLSLIFWALITVLALLKRTVSNNTLLKLIELLSRSSVTEFLPPLIILTSSLFYLSEYYGDRFLGKTSKLKTYKMLDIFLG
nr:KUP/HAK/KT family potassium transporter [Coxiella burnetii]